MTYSKHHSVGMGGGGSLGFAGSFASFCMALLKAYCGENTGDNYIIYITNNLQVLNSFSKCHLARMEIKRFLPLLEPSRIQPL